LQFVLEKKLSPGETRGFVVLLEFLRGVLEKVGGWTWFFDGENVVDCVVNVVRKTMFLTNEKYATLFNFILGTV
jgi:hypothetical protein